MKQIQELIKATQVLRVEGNSDTRVSRLAYDSRRIAPGDCFFAVSGTQSDGHAYIDAAVAAGAVAVVCQRLPEHLAPSVCYVVVADTNAAMADMAAAFYGDPSRQLKLVGITGTNGKTTTVTLLYDLFRGLGYKVWSDLDGRLPHRHRTHRIDPHHARRHPAERDDGPHGRSRVRILLHGGFLARHRAGTHPGTAFHGRHLLEHHPRPSGLPQDFRRIYPGKNSSSTISRKRLSH